MKNIIAIVAALAIIVGSGFVHGSWTNRWQRSAVLNQAVARLESLPTVLGDWTATSQPVSERHMAVAGAVGQISRVYTNPQNGVSVSVMLLCGLPGNISTHTPEICYPGAGYALGDADAYTISYGDPEHTARFQTALASRSGTNPSLLRLFWGWHSSNGWSAPRNARWAYAAEPFLAKLYVVRETGGAAIDPEHDPASKFLSLLLPGLDQVLSPSEQVTTPRSSGPHK